MSHTGVKIPLNCAMLCIPLFILVVCITLSLGLYSFFMNLLKEPTPWYVFLVFFVLSIPLVASIVVSTAGSVYLVCNIFRNYILNAWKDFTVEVEPGVVVMENPYYYSAKI